MQTPNHHNHMCVIYKLYNSDHIRGHKHILQMGLTALESGQRISVDCFGCHRSDRNQTAKVFIVFFFVFIPKI